MITIKIKNRLGKVSEKTAVDLESAKRLINSQNRKDMISLDGGATFLGKGDVKDADISEAFAKLTGEKSVSPPALSIKIPNIAPKSAVDDSELELRISTAVVGVVDGLTDSIVEAFSEVAKRVEVTNQALVEHAKSIGEYEGTTVRIDDSVKAVLAELHGRLSTAAINNEVSLAVSRATQEVAETFRAEAQALEERRLRIERDQDSLKRFASELEERLSHDVVVTQVESAAKDVKVRLEQQVAALEGRIESLKHREEVLLDIRDETEGLVSDYKPGTIERLRQELETVEGRLKEKEDETSELTAKISELQTQIYRLKASEHLESVEEIDRKLAEFSVLRSEMRKLSELEGENRQLQRDLDELKSIQRANDLHDTERASIREALEREHELQKKLDNLQNRNDSLENENSRLTSKTRDFQQRLNGTEDRLTAAMDELRRERQENQAFRELQSDFERRSNELREEHQNLLLQQDELKIQKTEFASQCIERAQEVELHNQAILEGLQNELTTRNRRELEEEYRAKFNNLEAELSEKNRQVDRLLEIEKKYRSLTALENQRDSLIIEVADLKSEIRSNEDKLDATRCELSGLNGDIGSLHREFERFENSQAERRRELEDRYEVLRRALEERYSKREAELNVDQKTRVESIHTPHFTRIEPLSVSEAPSEKDWLKDIADKMEAEEYIFPPRLLNAFHTSLKIASWAPLTVLAGVSGTGKSELPRLYSMFGGVNHMLLSVQPNWDSPQDLFGFFNYMDNRYKATTLLQAMVQSQRKPEHGGLQDQLLIVLLDEMNLARVELYFSEFLSKLEARRGLSKKDWPSLGVDVGSGNEERVVLGENILFVGTMNEDETTQTLSDKVLDRGNVITFPRPKKLQSREKEQSLEATNSRLPLTVWESWKVTPNDGLNSTVRHQIGEALDGVNMALRHANRAIGHRVLQAVEQYVVNHPDVRAGGPNPSTDDFWKSALEDQFVQKIMPKLRGVETDTKSGQACLEEIRRIIVKSTPGLTDDFEQAMKSGYGTFQWSSADYLTRNGER